MGKVPLEKRAPNFRIYSPSPKSVNSETELGEWGVIPERYHQDATQIKARVNFGRGGVLKRVFSLSGGSKTWVSARLTTPGLSRTMAFQQFPLQVDVDPISEQNLVDAYRGCSPKASLQNGTHPIDPPGDSESELLSSLKVATHVPMATDVPSARLAG